MARLAQTHVLHVAQEAWRAGWRRGSQRPLEAPSCPPGASVTYHLHLPPPASLYPVSHLCGQVGRGRRRSPHGRCRWILGHRWRQHSRPGSPRSPCLPSHSHTHNGSRQLSSGRYPRFCSEGDPEPHIRPHLQSNPSLPRGRGQVLELGAL